MFGEHPLALLTTYFIERGGGTKNVYIFFFKFLFLLPLANLERLCGLPNFWFPILLTYFWTGSGEVHNNINLTYKHYDVFLLYGEQGNVPNCRYLYSKEMYFLPHTCDRHSIIFYLHQAISQFYLAY